MIDFLGYVPDKAYFAAYNGYSGFYSLFDRIFDPIKHTRVYILKGGPGTGKSTLLKGLIKWANIQGIASEAIYCSSDPSSLDGVILRKKDKSVAILDGTAPHTFDPKYPGAKDEIINLGDGFITKELTSRSDLICSLGKKKAEAYSDAYSYLSIAGEIKRVLNKQHERAADARRRDAIVEELRERLDGEDATDSYEIFCISSFGRHGYTRSCELYKKDKTVISISGDGYTEYSVMKTLAEYLKGEKKLKAICPSPFGDGDIEAIYTENYLLLVGEEGVFKIETTAITKDDINTAALKNLYNTSLELAKKAFEAASEWHFKLEDVYSNCMLFENNERIYSNLIKEINTVLS